MWQPTYDKHASYTMIEYWFEHGIYTAEQIMWYVDNGNITKDDFHFITGYNYDGLKSSLEKQKNGGHL